MVGEEWGGGDGAEGRDHGVQRRSRGRGRGKR